MYEANYCRANIFYLLRPYFERMEAILKRLDDLERENRDLRENADKVITVKKTPSVKFPMFKLDSKCLSAREWYVEARDVLDGGELNENEKVAFLKEHITGDAYIDIVNSLSREDLKLSDNILASFESLFCGESEGTDLIKKLWCSKQLAGESVTQFARNMLTTNRRITNYNSDLRLDDKCLCSIFIKGVRTSELRKLLSTYLESNKNCSFDQLKCFAISIEGSSCEDLYEARVESHQVNNKIMDTVNKLQEKVTQLSAKLDQLNTRNNEHAQGRKNIKCFSCSKLCPCRGVYRRWRITRRED